MFFKSVLEVVKIKCLHFTFLVSKDLESNTTI